jgi:hypothetical protein
VRAGGTGAGAGGWQVNWDEREYRRQRSAFVANRGEFHPLGLATTLIFGATWLSGWLFSTLLYHGGVKSMPLRYALAFLCSYLVFFGCVRVWCGFIQRNRSEPSSLIEFPAFDDGCLWVLLIFVAAAVPALLFWLSGGFAALLEVAFEVAFAGTVVRRLGRTHLVGNWARSLLAGTWMHALIALAVLVGTAALLQRAAPNAETFAQALGTIAKR